MIITLFLLCALHTTPVIQSAWAGSENSSVEKILSAAEWPLPDCEFRRPSVIFSALQNYISELQFRRLTDDPRTGEEMRKLLCPHRAVVVCEDPSQAMDYAYWIRRLWAEFQHGCGRNWAIRFRISSGGTVEFREWADGYRPYFRMKNWVWLKRKPVDYSIKALRDYLEFIDSASGTYELTGEMNPVRRISDLQVGDVIVDTASSGRIIMIMSIAVHKYSGRRIALLAGSGPYFREFGLLRNPTDDEIDPWFWLDWDKCLYLPDWIMMHPEFRRFVEEH